MLALVQEVRAPRDAASQDLDTASPPGPELARICTGSRRDAAACWAHRLACARPKEFPALFEQAVTAGTGTRMVVNVTDAAAVDAVRAAGAEPRLV